MKLSSMNVEKKPKIMIIPMIDIIFFLLVFFMMSMLTMVTQKTVNLNLPQTASAKLNVEKTLPISVTSDGTIYVEQEKISKDDFHRRMEIEKNRNPDLAIVLRADSKSEHGDFVFVLDQLKSVGISKIGIATESKSGQK
ncbi:ExbD/TolR family protein [Dialister sp.]|uniref:ExbD/TolR family protein n=1 Tax=Dialister sp. TaxID=1955814 RepID=UPI002E81184B|nr:biopolymer transporter ExbD [Dialister sp.]MEE3452990.1 biopolymer transporter ExbD [Dialister sp.]